jgi:heptaprenyl diphosphate synthase
METVQLADASLYPDCLPLLAVEQNIHDELRQVPEPMGAIYRHLLRSGGKRIRPVLILLCNRLYSSSVSDAISIATAAEMIHMASLVHDDIIDRADVRHGLPTVNQRWDNHSAVLVGDALLARALLLLVDARRPAVLQLMAEMLKEMCEGEINQRNALMSVDLTEIEYLRCIEKKTALFFAVCCESGALLGGSPQADAKALRQFGYRLGMAFQMIDDLKDVDAEAETWGKPIGADIRAGVITLPLIRAIQDPVYGYKIRCQIVAWQRNAKELSTDRHAIDTVHHRELQQLLALIQATDALEYTRQRAQEYAQSAISHIPANTDAAVKTHLLELVDLVICRQR